MTQTKTLHFLWHPDHVTKIPKELGEGEVVVALGRDVEYKLEENNIPYFSGKEYREKDRIARMTSVEAYVAQLVESPVWTNAVYRDIALGKVYAFSMREYLDLICYYVGLCQSLAEAYPANAWVLYAHPSTPPPSGGALASLMQDAAKGAAVGVAQDKKILFRVVERNTEDPVVPSTLKEIAESILIQILNAVVTLSSRPKVKRFLISDHWRNMGTAAEKMSDAEFWFVGKAEIGTIGIVRALRKRIRFVSLRASEKRSYEKTNEPVPVSRVAEVPSYIFEGVDVTEIVRAMHQVLNSHIEHELVGEIDRVYRILERGFDAVVLRASTSAQTHLVVTALAAQACSIPVVELQHGLEYLGPGSISPDHTAENIAIYGKPISRELEERGYKKENLIEIGSPRFDMHPSLHSTKQNVLTIAPDVYIPSALDSYDVEDYFKSFFEGVTEVTIPVAVKLRNKARGGFFSEVLKRTSGGRAFIVVADEKKLVTLLAETRVLVSCYSTSILEALAAHIPVILLAPSMVEKTFADTHFNQYGNALTVCTDALSLAHELNSLSNTTLYNSKVHAGDEFMAREFRFDGKGAERLAEYLEHP